MCFIVIITSSILFSYFSKILKVDFRHIYECVCLSSYFRWNLNFLFLCVGVSHLTFLCMYTIFILTYETFSPLVASYFMCILDIFCCFLCLQTSYGFLKFFCVSLYLLHVDIFCVCLCLFTYFIRI